MWAPTALQNLSLWGDGAPAAPRNLSLFAPAVLPYKAPAAPKFVSQTAENLSPKSRQVDQEKKTINFIL